MMKIDDQQMLPIGTLLKLGEYRVMRYIASGGFGNTYEVEHVRLGKRLALKEFFMRGINMREGTRVSVSLEDNRQAFSQMREKFYKEAQRLARLEEQHIVEVTDFFEENATAYYVMKLIVGESLAAKMKRTGQPFGEKELQSILPQVLSALKTVHTQAIYHLDIKPGNIVQNGQGFCWLIDFGASKQLSAQESQTMSTSTGLCYTPGYAPSEQISGSIKRIGPWTDFYALGATVYNLLTNQAPPEVDDVKYDGEAAFQFSPTVSSDMRQLVLWLMQADYRQRPQTVEDIEQRMANLQVPTPETVIPKAPTPEPVIPEVPIPEPAIPEEDSSVETVLSEESHQAEPEGIDDNPTVLSSNSENHYPHQSDEEDEYDIEDNAGQVVIPCQWKDAGSFNEGLAYVKDDNDKYGFIDKTGKMVIPCQWEYADSFNEGLACVEDDLERRGFIDKSGKVVIPCQWTEVGSFNKGIAYVKDDNDKYGFIDMSGRVVIPCQWEYAGSFNEGLACVNDGNDKFGFIDKSGKVVIPCNWKDVSDFCEGLARVKDDYEMDGFIDKSGKVVIPCRWRVAWEFSEGLAHVDENYRYGFIDKSGKVVISCQWESAGFFNEGLAPVKDSKGKWGFVVSASNP